jgi:hypothetical protein
MSSDYTHCWPLTTLLAALDSDVQRCTLATLVKQASTTTTLVLSSILIAASSTPFIVPISYHGGTLSAPLYGCPHRLVYCLIALIV